MCKGNDDTQTTTQREEVPAYIQSAQQNLINAGDRLSSPFLQNAPGYAVAGFNPDQTMGFDLARGVAQHAFTNPGFSHINTTLAGTPALARMTSAGFHQGDTHQMGGAQLNQDDIAQFMNPYTRDVIDANMGDMSRTNDQQLAALRARAAKAGAFGGSRGALMEAEQGRNFLDTSGRMAAGLRQQGFTTAAGLGQGNAQLRQQTDSQNMAARNAMQDANAGRRQQSEMANAQAANNLTLANANAQNQYNLSNQAAHNNMAQFNSTFGNTWENDDQLREMKALQMLLGTGQTQQQLAQKGIDVPWEALERLRSSIPGLNNTGGTKTTEAPDNSPGFGQQLLGAGLTALPSILGFLSDEDTKINKQKIGRVNGVDMYAYDYAADVAAAKKSGAPMGPKRVGPMAGDIEKAEPGSTTKIGNLRVILGA
jgi:hypothetical protein